MENNVQNKAREKFCRCRCYITATGVLTAKPKIFTLSEEEGALLLSTGVLLSTIIPFTIRTI